MWTILAFFLSFQVFSLESFEMLSNVKIFRVLPKNIVVINKGLEDGINRNDHAKFSNEVAGYSSRALCVKASMNISYWKLYRIPDSEAFSLDYAYTLTGMADREIPLPVARLRNEVLSIEEEKKIEKNEKDSEPHLIKSDLPEKLGENDIPKFDEKIKKSIFRDSFDSEQFNKDLKNYKISLYASPFVKQSINQSQNLRYGFRGVNSGSKYKLLSQFEKQETKLKDPVTKESATTKTTNGQIQFIIHSLQPSISSLALINYNSQYFTKIGTPASHWQFGPLGLTWHLYQSKTWDYIDISYVPLYDVRETEILKNGLVSKTKDSGIRHGFQFGIKSRINDRVAFENILWVKPFQDPATWEIQTDNLNMVNDLKFIFNLTKNLFFDYNFIYQKDKLWKTLSNLPESNTINSINIRYDLSL